MKIKLLLLTITAAAAVIYTQSQNLQAETPHEHAETPAGIKPAEALTLLKEGNNRFVASKLEHPHQTALRREELTKGQHPFAIVLGCADSRTSPEVLFDQGLGDVFVVRVAGNVLNDETLGSIEYATEHLGAHLIVVLGHERCGAVKAAKETIAAHATAPGHIQSLVKAIQPAVDATTTGDAEATAKANELYVAQKLRDCGPLLKEKIASGSVQVVGAHYDLDTGVVEFLKEPAGK